MLGLPKVIGLAALVATVRGMPVFDSGSPCGHEMGKRDVDDTDLDEHGGDRGHGKEHPTVFLTVDHTATVFAGGSPITVYAGGSPITVYPAGLPITLFPAAGDPVTVTVTTTTTATVQAAAATVSEVDSPVSVSEADSPVTFTVTTTSTGAGGDLPVMTSAGGSSTATIITGVATITSTSTSTAFRLLHARQDQDYKGDVDVLVTVTQSHQGEPLATHTVDVPRDSVYLLPPVTKTHGPVTTVTVTEFVSAASTPVVVETVYADPEPTTTITETAPETTHTLNALDVVARAIDEDEVYTTTTVTPEPVTLQVVTHTEILASTRTVTPQVAGPRVSTIVVPVPSTVVVSAPAITHTAFIPGHTSVIPAPVAPAPAITYKTTKIPSKSGGPHTGPPIITPLVIGT